MASDLEHNVATLRAEKAAKMELPRGRDVVGDLPTRRHFPIHHHLVGGLPAGFFKKLWESRGFRLKNDAPEDGTAKVVHEA